MTREEAINAATQYMGPCGAEPLNRERIFKWLEEAGRIESDGAGGFRVDLDFMDWGELYDVIDC